MSEKLTKERRESLSRLSGALESRKERDAAALKEIQAAVDALDARRAALEAAVPKEAAAVAQGDMRGWIAYEEWRRLTRAKIDALAARRDALLQAAETQRDRLRRSNGETEALKRLLTPSKRR